MRRAQSSRLATADLVIAGAAVFGGELARHGGARTLDAALIRLDALSLWVGILCGAASLLVKALRWDVLIAGSRSGVPLWASVAS